MKTSKQLVLYFILFSMGTIVSQPIVIFTVNSLVKQNTDARKKVLLRELQQAHQRKNFGTMALWHTIRDSFEVPFFCNERSVRDAFFKFLGEIKIEQTCPPVIFEGIALPPIMAAWNVGKLDANAAIKLADEFIQARDCSDDNKKFYRAMIHITFDPEVSKTTRLINQKTQKLLDMCRNNGHKTYLVGHGDAALDEWLKEKCADVLAKFDKVFFSRHAQTLPQTFDDVWWLEQLGLVDATGAKPEYVYIDDWLPGGVRGDAPPHYASTSKALKQILN